MDKIQATSLSIFYITKKIEEEIVDGYISNIQLIDEDSIKLKINKKGVKQLIINKEVLFLSNYIIPVITSTGFIKYLKKKLYNKKIRSITQDKNNRVVYFKLDEHYLIFEFFSNSNIILTDENWNIISAKKYESWKDRKIKRKEIYKFPIDKDLKNKTEKEIIEDLKKSIGKNINEITKKEIIGFFVRNYNIHPIYFSNLKDKINIKNVIKNLKELFKYKNPKLTIIERDNRKVISCEEQEKPINIINFFDTLDNYYFKKNIIQKTSVKNSKKSKVDNILKEQEKANLKFLKKIDILNKEGEYIYSYFNIIDDINKQIKIATKKKIAVKEIKEKINEYFKKAKINLKVKKIDLKYKKYILKIN